MKKEKISGPFKPMASTFPEHHESEDVPVTRYGMFIRSSFNFQPDRPTEAVTPVHHHPLTPDRTMDNAKVLYPSASTSCHPLPLGWPTA